MKRKPDRKAALTTGFIAAGLLLPFLVSPETGLREVLQPMHYPVFLCAYICGWKYGAAAGIIIPLLRSLLFGMPPLFPDAIAMAAELGTYGLIAGYLFQKEHSLAGLFLSLVSAMAGGRIVWGAAFWLLTTLSHVSFGWDAFITAIGTVGIPGIFLQLILIPLMVVLISKTSLMTPLKKSRETIEIYE